MKFGVGINTCREGYYYPAGFSGPKEMVEVARLAEKLGFYSVWGDEHVTPTQAMADRDPQPPNFHELFMSLAFVAGATSKIRVGAGVVCMPWRDPYWVAKQASTLDVASNGRFLMALGLGASKEELTAINPKGAKFNRGNMLDEGIDVLQLLFTEKWATYKGEYYQLENVSMYPKPIQKPFPLIISGESENTMRRIAQLGSGCFISPSVKAINGRIEALKPLVAEYRRSMDDIEIITLNSVSVARTHDEAVKRWQSARISERYKKLTWEQTLEANVIGTPAEMIERIEKLQKAGLRQFGMQRFAARTHAELMEQVQMVGEEVLPHFKNKK